jgi:hypothetical protein
MLHGTHNVK